MKIIPLAAVLGIFPTLATADLPEVLTVEARDSGGTYTFNVTLRHADTGWDHYADGWGVYTTDGVELGYRVLAHPHVNEQPFTRSLGGVTIPPEITEVIIRPHDLVHGSGPDFLFALPSR